MSGDGNVSAFLIECENSFTPIFHIMLPAPQFDKTCIGWLGDLVIKEYQKITQKEFNNNKKSGLADYPDELFKYIRATETYSIGLTIQGTEISAIVLYFMTEGRHFFVLIMVPQTLTLKLAMPLIFQRLASILFRVTLLFNTSDDEEYEDLWKTELTAALGDMEFWLYKGTNRESILLENTLINCDQFATISKEYFENVLSLALSEYHVIIRSSGPNSNELVSRWLHTIALFLPDHRLFFSGIQCISAVVPGLALQGTTEPLEKIKEKLMWFQLPVAIIDIDHPLNKKHHFLPERTSINKRYRSYKFWVEQRLAKKGGARDDNRKEEAPGMITSVQPNSKESLALSSGIVHSICERFFVLANKVRKSPSNKTDASAILFLLTQWRRKLYNMALSFCVKNMKQATYEAHSSGREVADFADHHIFFTTIEYIFPLGKIIESIVSKRTMDDFNF